MAPPPWTEGCLPPPGHLGRCQNLPATHTQPQHSVSHGSVMCGSYDSQIQLFILG